MNECNYVTSSFQCKNIHGIPYIIISVQEYPWHTLLHYYEWNNIEQISSDKKNTNVNNEYDHEQSKLDISNFKIKASIYSQI